jgi:glucokinase
MSILGIDLGGTNVRAGRVKNESIEKITTSKITSDGAEELVLKEICQTIDNVIQTDVIGIGVGVPSIVDTEEGIVYDVQNIPSWKEVHLKVYLEKRYNLPVYVNNDANCFVAGEKYFGNAKDFENVVGLIIGTGLGAGLILNNKLYSGKNCGAGEFGMISFKEHNYEYYCSGQFFSQCYSIEGTILYDMAKRSESKALQIFSEFGCNLGEAIKLILYSIDPQMIILGGSLSKSFEFYKESMWKSVNKFEYKRSLDNLKIGCTEIKDIAVLGAAALYLDAQQK